jgi:prevent-host-death family protein
MSATIGAGEFKAKCLHLLDEVALRREEVIITKRGRPVAKLVPITPSRGLFGSMKGSVVNQTDLVSPVDVDWEAEV